MSKHIKRQKLQFAAYSLFAVSVVLFGSTALKSVGAHDLVQTEAAKVARIQPGLVPAKVAADITYDPSGSMLLGEPGKDEHPDTVPVLLYHGLVPKRDRFSMTPETFREQMFALKRNGFNSISLEQYLAFREGAELPPRSFLLTFDDGRTDSYVQADPVLKATGFTAVMFIAGDASLDSTRKHNAYYLNKLDLQAMVSSGRWQIASHAVQETGGQIAIDAAGTKANFLSNRMWLPEKNRLEYAQEYTARLEHELVGNKERIERELGVRVTAFSYPYGDFGNQQVNNPGAEIEIARVLDANYPLAFRQVWDNDSLTKTNDRSVEPLQQKRIEVQTDFTGEELVASLARAMDKPLPFVDQFDRDKGWRSTWGSLTMESGDLVLKAAQNGSGADALLDGSEHWGDYVLRAQFAWTKGSHFTIVGRHGDDSYVQCSYGEGKVRLDEVRGDKVTVIAVADASADVGIDHDVGMRLKGTEAQCFVGAEAAVTGTVPAGQGRAGFKVWDKTPNNAEVRIRQVQVGAEAPQPIAPAAS